MYDHFMVSLNPKSDAPWKGVNLFRCHPRLRAALRNILAFKTNHISEGFFKIWVRCGVDNGIDAIIEEYDCSGVGRHSDAPVIPQRDDRKVVRG